MVLDGRSVNRAGCVSDAEEGKAHTGVKCH